MEVKYMLRKDFVVCDDDVAEMKRKRGREKTIYPIQKNKNISILSLFFNSSPLIKRH